MSYGCATIEGYMVFDEAIGLIKFVSLTFSIGREAQCLWSTFHFPSQLDADVAWALRQGLQAQGLITLCSLQWNQSEAAMKVVEVVANHNGIEQCLPLRQDENRYLAQWVDVVDCCIRVRGAGLVVDHIQARCDFKFVGENQYLAGIR